MTKIGHWQQMIQEIHKDAQGVLDDHHNIYKSYVELVNSSPINVRTPFDFHDFVRRQHGSAVAMFIRRQTDTKNISLYKILLDLEKNSELINLEWFKSLYGEQADWAPNDFQQFTTDGQQLAPSVPKNDRLALLSLGENINKYANERLAHRSLTQTLSITYNDLDAFLDQFEEILKKYLLLLEGVGYGNIAPIPQYDWQKIFKQPWIG